MSFYTPITKNGGAGSGNFGHAGRPGERGGSAPTGTSTASDNPKRKGFEDSIKTVKEAGEGVSWVPMEKLKDGREVCLVVGWGEGYDEDDGLIQQKVGDDVYTLCAKLAVNIDDLQADYGMDWYEPWDKKSGEVWDTDMAVSDASDFDWYADQAKKIAKGLDKGTLEVN